ncbi:MAG: sodium:proton antiporter, partial [Prevotella sp.]|nr:sodium:proton antiporter [Prevotella sp.]
MTKQRIILSLTPVIFLIALLAIVIRIYGTEALDGGSQMALILATGVCALIAVFYFKVPWKNIEKEINNSVGSIGTTIVILLLIGILSGTWTVSGVVPTFIYYGMQIINPHIFLISSCIISGIVSVMTGSSW